MKISARDMQRTRTVLLNEVNHKRRNWIRRIPAAWVGAHPAFGAPASDR